jgi:hypothetical protein
VSRGERYILAVEALEAVGCPETAAMTRDAIRALGLGDSPTGEEEGRFHRRRLGENRYFANDEPIADRLFAWIKESRELVKMGRHAGGPLPLRFSGFQRLLVVLQRRPDTLTVFSGSAGTPPSRTVISRSVSASTR